MRRRSKKTAALYRKYGPRRAEYLREHPRCMLCRTNPSSGVHEILSGPYRMLSFAEPATWLATCGVCNCNRLTDRAEWPVPKQLALKLIMDHANYDLDKVNEIWTPRNVSQSEVDQWIEYMEGLDTQF